MAKLIGMKAILDHFKGEVGEDKIRQWIKEYGFPAVSSTGKPGGTLLSDSDAVDQWYISYVLKGIVPKGAAEMITDRIMTRPARKVSNRKKDQGKKPAKDMTNASEKK